jgi:hypothetical protein
VRKTEGKVATECKTFHRFLFSIVFKPNPVVDPVSWTGYGSDELTRVSPGQSKIKKKKKNSAF